MKKGILIQLFSLLLVMAFMPGFVVAEEAEKPAGTTQEKPAKAESSAEPATDDAALADAAVSCKVKNGERSRLPWEPDFLVDNDNQPLLKSGIQFGSCAQTCAWCLYPNGQCPLFAGRPQKCMAQCP